MKNKLVSVVIPTYNRVDLIQETINSVLSQKYNNFEIIVLDNNSDDSTYEILNKKYNKFSFIKIYKNEITLDIVRNWRKCFEYAVGKYILILWSDDLISQDFLSKTVNFLESNPNAGFVYTLTNIFNNENGKTKNVFQLKQSGLLEKKIYIEKSLLDPPLSVPVSPANSLFRRKDVDKNLLIDIPNNYDIDFSKIGQGNDNLLFLLTLKDYTHFGYINECHSYFRDHNQSITLSTHSFLVTLRYHIAKSFYVNNSDLEKRIILKFNSKLILIMIVCKLIGIRFSKKDNQNIYNILSNYKYRLKYIILYFIRYIIYKINKT